MTGSWSDITKNAAKAPTNIPKLLRTVPWFAPIFLLTYPHRTTPQYMKLIDVL
jgi:hypothetical protein